MKNINDYPFNIADCYEVANWLNSAEKYGHLKYNDSKEVALAHQKMVEAGWTFHSYDSEYGTEIWRKPKEYLTFRSRC